MSEQWISDDELKNILGSDVVGDDEANEQVEDQGALLEKLLEGVSSDDDEDEVDDTEKSEVEVTPLVLEAFSESDQGGMPIPGMETLYDVPLDIRVVLGSAEKSIEEILELKVDSVVKLSKMAGELVDIIVGNQPIAKGEVVVIDDKFGILINEILPPQERVRTVEKKLKRQKQ